MAKRLFQAVAWTASPAADAAAMASLTYQAVRGATATQKVDILEVMISGLATSSAVLIMQLARASVIGCSTSALVAPDSDGPMDASTAALQSPVLTYRGTSQTSATGPQRSNATSDARLELAINAFGGIIRWNAAPTQQWNLIGNSATTGESVLSQSSASGSTTGTTISSHIMYEPY